MKWWWSPARKRRWREQDREIRSLIYQYKLLRASR